MIDYLKTNFQIFLLYFITFVVSFGDIFSISYSYSEQYIDVSLTLQDLFAVGLVVPLISSHVLSLGGTHIIVGLMGSFYSGLQLFSSPILVITHLTLIYHSIFSFYKTKNIFFREV